LRGMSPDGEEVAMQVAYVWFTETRKLMATGAGGALCIIAAAAASAATDAAARAAARAMLVSAAGNCGG
jgi:hypothetical protein